MLFTDKIPGVLDINGLPKLNKTPEYFRRTFISTLRFVCEYINGVDDTDGYLVSNPGGAYRSGPPWVSKGPTMVLDRNFVVKKVISSTNVCTNINRAVRVSNDIWILASSSGNLAQGAVKVNLATDTLDPTFSANWGTGSPNGLRFFKRIGDYIYTTSSSNVWNGVTRKKLIRIDLNGAVDTSWVVSHNSETVDIALLPDGKFFAPIAYTSSNFVRLLANGTVDNTFTIAQPTDYAREIYKRPDGTFFIVGDFVTINGLTRNKMCCIDATSTNGTLLSDYGTGLNDVSVANQSGWTCRIYSAVPHPDGSYICAGLFLKQEGDANQLSICKIRPDGTMDPTFRCRVTESGGTGNWSGGANIKPITIKGRNLILCRGQAYPVFVNGIRATSAFLIDYTGRLVPTTL